MTETEIRGGERKVERKSIPDRKKNIFRDWGQEYLRNLKWYSPAGMEREREKKEGEEGERERLRLRKRNGVGWEEGCLTRVMIVKRGLENMRFIDMILKRWDFFLENREFWCIFGDSIRLFLKRSLLLLRGEWIGEGRTIGRETCFSNPGEMVLAEAVEIEGDRFLK